MSNRKSTLESVGKAKKIKKAKAILAATLAAKLAVEKSTSETLQRKAQNLDSELFRVSGDLGNCQNRNMLLERRHLEDATKIKELEANKAELEKQLAIANGMTEKFFEKFFAGCAREQFGNALQGLIHSVTGR